MRPVVRAAISAGSVVLVGLLAVGFRTLNAYGVFTDVTPGFAGSCTAIAGVRGPEDIVIDAPSGLAFISAMDRRAFAAGKPSPQDGLFLLRPSATAVSKLSGAPKDFHPHGISLVRDANGRLTLLAINHRADGSNSIEVFDVVTDSSAVSLRQTGSITSGQLVSPNAIAAVDGDHFYVVNDHGSSTAFGRTLEDLLLLPRADLLYFDGMVFHVVASGEVCRR